MGKGSKRAKINQNRGKKGNQRCQNQRNGNFQKQKNVQKGGKTNQKYEISCEHFNLIDENKVHSVFRIPEIKKVLSEKNLTKKERANLQKRFTLVTNWNKINGIHLCLCCGTFLSGKNYEDHFLKKCCLSFSFETRTITCTNCNNEYSIEQGTLMAEILGIKYNPTPLAIASASKPSKESVCFPGLINLGNSCWMNSVLQILVHLPFIFIKPNVQSQKTQPSLIDAFNYLRTSLYELETSNQKSFRPREFVNELKQKIDFLDVREQHDAFEFLITFLDSIRDEQGGTISGMSSTDKEEVKNCLNTQIDTMFGFIIERAMKEKCQHENTIYERNLSMSLNIPVFGETTLSDCIKINFDEELLEDHVCDVCNKTDECTLTTSLDSSHLPQILIIHLSRFRYGHNGYVKNNIDVRFTETLNLKESLNVDATYSLFGYVSHYGSIDTGHYTSLAKLNGHYYLFDDETVTEVDPERGFQLQPYILFYILNKNNQ